MCETDKDRADGRLNQPSPLERYFGRPVGSASDELTYAQYFLAFSDQEQGRRGHRSVFLFKSYYSQIQTGILYSQRRFSQRQRTILPEVVIARD
jgi:hypothetical protein